VKILGYDSVEELMDRNLEETGFEPAYPRNDFKNIIERDGKVEGLESAWIRKDGTAVFIRESAVAIKDGSGKVLFYEGNIEEITERKKAEDQIRRERILLRTLIDNLPDMIYVKDSHCRKIISNRADYRNFGYENEADVLNKTDIELFQGETGERGYLDDLSVIEVGKKIINVEEDFIGKNNRRRWFLTT
jgi:PAS domain S-box-containing protein